MAGWTTDIERVAGSSSPSQRLSLQLLQGRELLPKIVILIQWQEGREEEVCVSRLHPRLRLDFFPPLLTELLSRFFLGSGSRRRRLCTREDTRAKQTRAGTLDVKGLSRILRRCKLFENNKLKGSPLRKYEKAKEERNYLNYFCCFSRPLSLTLNLSHLSLQKLPFPHRTFATSAFLFSSSSDGIHPFIQLLLWVLLRKREREREVPVAIVE